MAHVCSSLVQKIHNQGLHPAFGRKRWTVVGKIKNSEFYVILTVHLDAILGNDQLDALFLNVFILCLYMFRAASAHHQEGDYVLIQFGPPDDEHLLLETCRSIK
jgi:hypothetical protein